MVVSAVDIVATSVAGRAVVTRNVLGGLLRKLVMSKPLNNQADQSIRVNSGDQQLLQGVS